MAAPRILVIDDSKQVLLVTVAMLKKIGFEVISTGNPKEGFVLANAQKPDLIMMDIMMPEIDGFQLCSLLKSRDETKAIPVIMATAKNSRKDILRAREVGASNYMVKPVSADILKTKLGSELQKINKPLPWATVDAAAAAPKPEEAAAETSRFSLLKNPDPETGIKYVLNKTKELLALPFAVTRALNVSDSEASGAADLGKIIASDVAITTMVLKKANSAFYGTAKKILDVREAIVRIGFKQTRNIVISLSVMDFLTGQQKSRHFNRLEFWEHSLATAIFANHLAARLRLPQTQDPFICGLMHDVGKILLDENAPEEFDEALHIAREQGRPLYQVERELYKFDHMDLGAALIEKWSMPAAIRKAAASHARLADIEADADKDRVPLLKVIYYANILAKAYAFGNGGDQMLYPVDATAAQSLQLPGGIDPAMEDALYTEMNDFRVFLGNEARPKPNPKPDGRLVLFLAPDASPIQTTEIFIRSAGYRVKPFTDLRALITEAVGETGQHACVVPGAAGDADTAEMLAAAASVNKSVLAIGTVDAIAALETAVKSEKFTGLSGQPSREAIRRFLHAALGPA